jgi:glucose/arabinose dehydrogenase
MRRSRRSVHLLVATMAVALLACVLTLLALPKGPAQGATILPTGFTDLRVVSSLTSPTDMEFAPDGRLFVAEQAGKLRIAKPDGTLATFLDISAKVDSSGERGCRRLRLTLASLPTATSTSNTPRRQRPPPRFTTASCA